MKKNAFYTDAPKLWCPPKLLLIMKLSTFIMIISIVQVSAKGFGQKINLDLKDMPLAKVVKAIERQSGYVFLFDAKDLRNENTSIKVINGSIEQATEALLKGKSFSYKIVGKNVIVQKNEVSVLGKITSLFVQDSVNYKGTVLDETGKPLPGATVKIKGGSKGAVTTSLGNFVVYGPAKGIIVVSYLGYVTREINVIAADANRVIKITMSSVATGLGEVSIVSTGYQDLPKERATGSFELISKEQLQHSTDPNLLKRLEGITTSFDFRNDVRSVNSSNGIPRSPLSNLTIRGKNTLNPINTGPGDPVAGTTLSELSGQPLVVINGIPSPYPIDQINPNDVENITILKDAASASIWGSRAANGVIVIKTKKGNYQNPLQISFNSNVSITDKLDLFYRKTMTTSDYIDAQIFLYNKKYNPNDPNAFLGDPTLTTAQTSISPVADIMNQQKRRQITEAQAKVQLDALRNNDIRNDYTKYLLREAITQSYSLALSGGTKSMNWRLSGGYDRTLNNTKNSKADRTVLNYDISIKPLSKLELQASLGYSQSNTNDQSGFDQITVGALGNIFYPYTKLADDKGDPLAIPRTYTPQFLNLLTATYGSKILNYQYKPLEDINEGYNKTKLHNININLGAIYQILPSLSANITFNQNLGYNKRSDLKTQDSWYVRDLINRYTDPNTLSSKIPFGAQYLPTTVEINNQTLRGLLSFDKTWNDRHNLTAISGIDVNNNYSLLKTNEYYGYDPSILRFSNNIDFNTLHRLLFGDPISGSGYAAIQLANAITDAKVRTISYFSNAAYTFDKRYTLSASLRRDLSSLFGLGGDKGGTPFYSVGGSWAINNEKFYQINWLPYLKLRATYGYNGNVNPATASVPLLSFTPASMVYGGNSLEYSFANNPTNSKLRPEKTGVFNLGIDFGLKNSRLSGSIEYYIKKTKDLLTINRSDPSTGFNTITSNAGDLYGKGIDLNLNSLNVQTGLFRWNSNFLFSYNKVKITNVYSIIPPDAGSSTINITGVLPPGYDLSGIFAFKWAGLDPNTGDPRSYLNGQIVSISNTSAGEQAFNSLVTAPVSSLHYFGSGTPTYYGSFRNTFNYGSFSISANLLYKFGYWFRRPNSNEVFYSRLVSGNIIQGAEYANRWQKPGDENFTNVPSFTYPIASPSRDLLYQYSEINVLKADHIRLQEINLSYSFQKKNWILKNLRINANISNLGIIWRANKFGLDPDTFDYPVPRVYSFGLNANF